MDDKEKEIIEEIETLDELEEEPKVEEKKVEEKPQEEKHEEKEDEEIKEEKIAEENINKAEKILAEEKKDEVKEKKKEEKPKEKKKKKKKLPLIIIIIILILIIGAAIFFLLKNKGSKTAPTEDVVISFNTNGGEAVKEITLKKDEPLTLPTTTKKGYNFLGWFQGGKKVENKSTFTENTVLLAKWEKEDFKKEFTITFNPPAKPASITLKCGTPVFLEDVETPEKQNYYFNYWVDKETGKKYKSGLIYDCKDRTFEAVWYQRTASINFIYNLNGTRKNSYDLKDITIDAPSSYPCTDNMTLKLPEKGPDIEGYKFSNWLYRSWDGIMGKEAKNGDKLTCENIFIEAIYGLDIPEYTVHFDLNGGTGNCPDQKIGENNFVPNFCTPTREGYIFAGWSPIMNTPITKNTTFTAQWKAKQTPEPEPDPEPEPGGTENE